VVDDVACDDEPSVANKTKPGNQSLGAAVFVRLTGNSSEGRKQHRVCEKNRDPLDGNHDFTRQRQRSTVLALPIADASDNLRLMFGAFLCESPTGKK
jgi:hypothetical protein